MNSKELAHLRYKRQYVLLPFSITCPFHHNQYVVNQKYILYTHTDLNVTVAETEEKRLILLGELFDFEKGAFDNTKILNNLLKTSFKNFLSQLSKYTGRLISA